MSSGALGYLSRVATFLILGPVIGGVLFILVAPLVGGEPKSGLMAGFATLLLSFAALPFFLVGCYMLGWKAALVTGLVIGLVGPQIASRIAMLAMAAMVGAASGALLGNGAYDEKSGPIIAVAIVGAVSAAACAWFLDRIDMMRRRPPAAA